MNANGSYPQIFYLNKYDLKGHTFHPLMPLKGYYQIFFNRLSKTKEVTPCRVNIVFITFTVTQ